MRRRVIITSPERLPAATAMRDDGTRRLVGFTVAFSFGDVDGLAAPLEKDLGRGSVGD